MLRTLFRGWRHPLRLLAMGLGAFALAWDVAVIEGVIAAIVGALVGVVAGELLGRSRLRLPIVVGLLGLVPLVVWRLTASLGAAEFVADTMGPANALVLGSVLRFASLTFGATAALRALAARRPALLAVELATITAAITTVFASHREGVIARPLWLSDWAWQQGIDPSQALLAVGGVSVVLLAVLLVAESRSGRALSSLATLLALAACAVLFINVVGAPTPGPESELGLTDAGQGQDPRRTDAGGQHGRDPHGDGGAGNGGREDGGAGHGGPDAGDGGAGPGGDAGDGGAGAQGGDAGDGGGGGGSDMDAGDGGGSGGDAGDGGGGGGNDAQADVLFPHLIPTDGSLGNAPLPQDGGRPPPPSAEQLSDDQSPSNSPAPMAVVILDDDYSPPSQAYYFRQEVWSDYNGSRLVQTRRSDVDRDIARDFPTYDTPVADVPPTAGRTRVSGKVALLVEHAHPFALESPLRYSPAQNPNPQRFVRAWRFSSLAQTLDYRRLVGRRAGDPRWSEEVRQYFLQGPEDPRYRTLAERIVREGLPERLRRDPFARALAVKLYLDRELIYSTNRRYRRAGEADPTAHFLFGNRTGYCVHFAHSAVYLWRALGIPSRISTGYHSDESNRRGGSTIMLQARDAHAWPELHIEGMGWIVLDIAAERNIDPPGSGSAPDEDLQRILGEMARQEPPNPQELPPRPNQPRPETHRARNFGYGLLAAVLLALVALYAVKLWRRVVPALASPRQLPRVGYRKALDLLAEAGLHRAEGESREAFAARVAARVPSFVEITAMHLSARLGDPARAPQEHPWGSRGEWSTRLTTLRRELPAAAPRWRRALGLLHPASWLDAR